MGVLLCNTKLSSFACFFTIAMRWRALAKKYFFAALTPIILFNYIRIESPTMSKNILKWWLIIYADEYVKYCLNCTCVSIFFVFIWSTLLITFGDVSWMKLLWIRYTSIISLSVKNPKNVWVMNRYLKHWFFIHFFLQLLNFFLNFCMKNVLVQTFLLSFHFVAKINRYTFIRNRRLLYHKKLP